MAAAIASVLLSGALYLGWPSLPFMDRVGLVFVACFGVAIVLSLLQAPGNPPSEWISNRWITRRTSVSMWRALVSPQFWSDFTPFGGRRS